MAWLIEPFVFLLGVPLTPWGVLAAALCLVSFHTLGWLARRGLRHLTVEGSRFESLRGSFDRTSNLLYGLILLVGVTVALGPAGLDLLHPGVLYGGMHGVLDYTFFEAGGLQLSLASLLTLVVILFVFRVLGRLAHHALVATATETVRGGFTKGHADAIGQLLEYLVLAVGLVVGLETIGLNLAALLATAGVAALGLGVALQDQIRDYFAGLLLLVERTLKVGDVVRVDGQLGRVVAMYLRTTELRTLDEEQWFVPNRALVIGRLENLTGADRLHRVSVRVGVAYHTDARTARAALLHAARQVQRTRERKPAAVLADFGDSALAFDVFLFTTDPWRHRELESDFRFAVLEAFERLNIVIAFPQLDVHLDPEQRPTRTPDETEGGPPTRENVA